MVIAANPVATNQGFKSFVLGEELIPDFVYYYLQRAKEFAVALASGTTFLEISGKNAARLPIPVPPLPEQRRIVAEIEKQFTRLEAGVAALRRVQANLKRYRATVLKAACEGHLVPTEAALARSPRSTKNGPPAYETGEALLARILAERRQNWQGRGQYKEPAAPKTADLPTLPEGWTWATAQQLNLANRPCAYGVLQPGEDVPDGVPFVRVGDINNGKVELANMKRISTTIAAQYPRTKLHGGELAITLVGAIGRTAIIPDSLAGGNTARAVGIIPLTKQANAHWIEIWFRNPTKNAEMDSKSHEVARKTLNLEDVRVASVALPPLAEQTRIVAEVERRLSVVEELESVVTANLQRATRLRQAILQQAFTGRLLVESSTPNEHLKT
ncbi:MAG: restriction endonuclease subunit S [Verrucomicrobiae bacterium]